MLSDVVLVITGQGPLLVDVRVKITVPIPTSPGLFIMYEALSAVGPGLKDPLPLVDQRPVEVPPPTMPFRRMLPAVEHTDCDAPAFTVASFLMLIFTESETAGQAPLLVEVRVKVTEPLFISAGVME